MEFIDLLCIVNASSVLFIASTIFFIRKYKSSISESSYHHLLSHIYIILFFALSVNALYFKGYISPLIFSFLYMIQHVLKENIRISRSNTWTQGIKNV